MPGTAVCARQAVEFPSSDSTEGSPRGSSLSCKGKGALFTSPGLGELSGEPRPNLCLQGCTAQEVGAGRSRAVPGLLLLPSVPRAGGPQVLLLLKTLSPVIPVGLLLAACGQEASRSLSSC